MSFQAMTWALRQRTGNPTAKAVLLALANYADDEGSCFPGHEKLADHCECSTRTVIRQIEVLEELGFITVERRQTPNGARTSNRYFLALSDKMSPDKLSVPPCQNVSSNKDEPINEPTSLKIPAGDREAFAELTKVLDQDRAKALIEHRKALGKKLTGYAARHLAQRLAEWPDPNAAADEMITNGWQGFQSGWLKSPAKPVPKTATSAEDRPKAGENGARANSALPNGDKVQVSSALDPDLFAACERALGKSVPRDRNGAWRFDAEIVARARREVLA